MSDPVNHPPHYTSHPSGIECIQITEHMNFNCGNAVKYVWRSSLKHADPIIDLEKAEWYIRREIQRLKALQDVENLPSGHSLRSEQIGDGEEKR